MNLKLIREEFPTYTKGTLSIDNNKMIVNNHLEDNFLYVNVDNDQDVNNKILNVNEMLKINMIKKTWKNYSWR